MGNPFVAPASDPNANQFVVPDEKAETTVTGHHGGPTKVAKFDPNHPKQTGVPGTVTFATDPKVAEAYAKGYRENYVTTAELTGKFGDYKNPRDVDKVQKDREDRARAQVARFALLHPDIWTPERQAKEIASQSDRAAIETGHYGYWEQPAMWKKFGWDGAYVTEGRPGNPRNLSVGETAKMNVIHHRKV